MTNNTQRNSYQAINWFLNRNLTKGNDKVYLKWWKERTYNQEYSPLIQI